MSIDADAVIARLKEKVPEAKTIQHAWFMDAIENLEEETPALFVYPGPEKAHESELDNFISQQVEGGLVVFIVTRHNQRNAIRQQVQQALLGWQTTPYHNGLQFVEGDRRDASQRHIWWRDVYSDQFHIRQQT